MSRFDPERYSPRPRAPGMSYMNAAVKARIDMSESRVTPEMDEATWDMAASLGLSGQLTTGRTLIELVEAGRDDIVVCTADLGRPTQVIDFARRFPDRYFNFGIAERNMIGAAAGLATTGHLPVISNYAFFLALMGVENIRNDIAYADLPVRLVGSHSGIAMGFYGTSHHCCEDIGALRAIPNLAVLAPCDGNAIRAALTRTIDHPGPIYFRCGRGRETPVYDSPPTDWRLGGSTTLRTGGDATVLAIGNLVSAALGAAELLAQDGINITVVDMYSLEPLDRAAVRAAAARGPVLSAEEHNISAGFGSAIAEVIAEEGLAVKLTRIGMPDQYSILGPPTHLYRHYGLDAEGVAARVRAVLR